MFFIIPHDYQVVSLSPSLSLFPSQIRWCLLCGDAGVWLLCRAIGASFVSVPNCHLRWKMSSAQGPSTWSLSLSAPAQGLPPLAPGMQHWPFEPHQLPPDPDQSCTKNHGVQSADLMFAKENSWALLPLTRLFPILRKHLKTSPRFLTLFMSWCSHGNCS